MDRLSHITDRFTAHFHEIGATPVVMARWEWAEMPDQTNLRVSLGFRRVDVSDHLARFCSELAAAQTEHLAERDFHAYLDAIQYTVDFETERADLDLEAATAAADAALSDLKPGSLRLMTEVQMAWIDRQAGAS